MAGARLSEVGRALISFILGATTLGAPVRNLPIEWTVTALLLAVLLVLYQPIQNFAKFKRSTRVIIGCILLVFSWGVTKRVAQIFENRSYFYLLCKSNGGTVDPCDITIVNVGSRHFTNASFEIIDTKNSNGAAMIAEHVGDLEVGTTKTNQRIPQQGRYQVKLYSRETSYEENLDLSYIENFALNPKGEINQNIELKRVSEPPRDFRRLQLLRRRSHDKQDDEQILS